MYYISKGRDTPCIELNDKRYLFNFWATECNIVYYKKNYFCEWIVLYISIVGIGFNTPAAYQTYTILAQLLTFINMQELKISSALNS
jgi:hypothetical protein